jgi:hypothetical protein
MFKASLDDHGTVQALAQELDKANIDGACIISLAEFVG